MRGLASRGRALRWRAPGASEGLTTSGGAQDRLMQTTQTGRERSRNMIRRAQVRDHARRQACLAVAGRTTQATGIAAARLQTTLEHQDRQAHAQGGGSEGQGQWGPLPQAATQASRGTKHVSTRRAQRTGPRLAAASEQNSRHCWRTVCSLRPSHGARNALTAVKAQERARDHAETPQRQPRGWGLAQVGQVRLDGHRPFGDTGWARHTFPPRMYGRYGYPYNV